MLARSSTVTWSSPIGIVVTGLRDASRYGYAAYSGRAPTLDVDLGRRASVGEEVKPRRVCGLERRGGARVDGCH